MARRLKRRKPRVAWLPVFGAQPISEGVSNPWPGIEVELEIDDTVLDDDVVWDAFPLTFDTTQDAVSAQEDTNNQRTLRDIVEGNEWRLRRIVGKAFVGASHGVTGDAHTTLIDCALGFIVCKTYDDGAPVTDFNEVNPLAQDSMEDPWIWRRRWVLNPYFNEMQNQGGILDTDTRNTPAFWGFPQDTTRYGSVADGPHIDAKTARVIHRSERLYGVFAMRRWARDRGLDWSTVKARLLLDYRILGSLRGSSYGNRGNTSR